MKSITILQENEISDKNRVATVTDYAISNGAVVYEKKGKQKLGRYWTSTCNPDVLNATFVGTDGLCYPNSNKKVVNYGYGIGLRLGFKVSSDLFKTIEKECGKIIKDGEEFEYFAEIENLVSDELEKELNTSNEVHKLDYSCVRNKGVLKYFVSEKIPLYEYQDRVFAKVPHNYLKYKNKEKDYVWMEVKKIKWLRDNDNVISKNIITGGIDFHNWYYSGKFNETSVYHYINKQLVPEINTLGNILSFFERKQNRKKVVDISSVDSNVKNSVKEKVLKK